MRTFVAIDCAGEACSVAVKYGDDVVEQNTQPGERQSEILLHWVQELLAVAGLSASDLDAIAVGIGPGSFTGVRLAVAVAQGLAMALDRPAIPVSSLAALAADANEKALPIFAALDARMGEVYAGWYRPDETSMLEPLADEVVLAPYDLTLPTRVNAYVAIGSGVLAYEAAVTEALGAGMRIVNQPAPRAAMVAKLAARIGLAGAIAPEHVEPAYLRNKVALTSTERRALRRYS